jgi:hypothetical protein
VAKVEDKRSDDSEHVPQYQLSDRYWLVGPLTDYNGKEYMNRFSTSYRNTLLMYTGSYWMGVL